MLIKKTAKRKKQTKQRHIVPINQNHIALADLTASQNLKQMLIKKPLQNQVVVVKNLHQQPSLLVAKKTVLPPQLLKHKMEQAKI
jgi:hypothetical protein